MSMLVGFVSAVFWGMVLFSLLVFVHEGGHYLMARACGMRVTEFFLGMPCRYNISRRLDSCGTTFGVTPILLGGYTRICGMSGDDDPRLAQCLAIVQREGRVSGADVAAEMGVDIEDAYRLLATLADWASIEPYYDPEKGENPAQADYPECFQTIARDGVWRTRFDKGHDFTTLGSTADGEPRPITGNPAGLLDVERSNTYLGKGFLKRVAVLVAGPLVNLVVAYLLVVFGLMAGGVEYASNSNVISAVAEGSYAESAGLQGGDKIIRIDGHETSTWTEVSERLDPLLSNGFDFVLAYVRDGVVYETEVDLPAGEKVDLFGIYASYETYHPTFAEASATTVGYGALVIEYAVKLLIPTHTMEVIDNSSSIVGISTMASEAASTGFFDFILFLGAVSMSLGFMNLLPVPPLDGGKVLIEIIQLVARRQLSQKVQLRLSYAGLAFFMFVFVFALKNDLMRIFTS